MNRKGFTIAETLVTFVLVAFIGLTLLQLLLNYKDVASVKMKQQTYASIKDEITRRIEKEVNSRKLRYITQKGTNTLLFVFDDRPGEPYMLSVHSINFINSEVEQQYGYSDTNPMPDDKKYEVLADKYIEWGEVGKTYKFKIPSGLPDYSASDGISDYSKYQGVNINMGSIYYESQPITLSVNQYKTIYHIKISIGVTDLDEDYGLDLVFAVDGKGSNYELRNMITYNSSFESEEFYEYLQDYYDTNVNNEYDTQVTSDLMETTCNENGGATKVTRETTYMTGPYDLDKFVTCRCLENTVCYFSLANLVKLENNKVYTFSYYYKTNKGVSASLTDLELNKVCCKENGNDCVACTLVGDAPMITTANNKEWKRFIYTFQAPDSIHIYFKQKFAMKSDTAKSRIGIDAVQLEEGTQASLYQRT